MKFLTRTLLIALGLAALTLMLLLGLVLTLDPNRLKPLLQQEAAAYGLELRMSGDIRWRLFPNMGLSLGALNLNSRQDQSPLVAVEAAEMAVQLWPLLKRQIRVDGVRLDGLDVHYRLDAQGRSAWHQIGKTGAPATSGASGREQAPPELSVERVQITRLKMRYHHQATGDRLEIRDLQMQAGALSFTGVPFPVQLEFFAQWNQMAPVRLVWQGPVTLNVETRTLSFADARLDTRVGDTQLALRVSADTHWGKPISSKGQLELSPFALPPLLRTLGLGPVKTVNPSALQQVGVTLTYDLGPDHLQLNPVALALDQTRLNGHMSVQHFDRPVIRTRWQGSHMVIDDYLPPAAAPTTAAAVAQTPPQPLPLEAMRRLSLDAQLVFDSLVYRGLAMTQPQMQVVADKGVLKLDSLSLLAADGKVTGRGQLDARGHEALVHLDLESQGVDLGVLLQTFAELDKISGRVSAKARVTSRGATDQALWDNLVVEATAESQALRVVPVNIEEQFCRALALLQQQNLPQTLDWPDMTRLEPVQMQLRFAQNRLSLQQLNASIAHLLSAASGTFDIATSAFDIPLSVSLGDFAGGAAGCLPIEEKWRKRALPLRCKGSLDDIGIKTCRPDTQLLTDMLKEKVKGQAKEKLAAEQDRLEEKLEDKARRLLQEKLGEEKSKNTEESVRGLLKQLKKKPTEPAAPPAQETPSL